MKGQQSRTPRYKALRWRFVISAIIAISVWIVSQNEKWRDSTFIGVIEQNVFDEVVSHRANTVGGDAPSIVLLEFNQAAHERMFAGKPLRERPAETPLKVVQAAMETARLSQALMIVIDIDLFAPGARRDHDPELPQFINYLKQWSQDNLAPLVVFQRALHSANGQRSILAATPLDAVVPFSPNLTFASAEALEDQDSVLRRFAYVKCYVQEGLMGPGKEMALKPLPHPALYAFSLTAQRTELNYKHPKEISQYAKDRVENALLHTCRHENSTTFSLAGETFPISNNLIDYHLNIDSERATPGTSSFWNTRALQYYPEGPFTEHPTKLSSGKWAIFILASSQASFPDAHLTPFGRTIGAVVVANQIRGTILHGPIHGLPWYISVALLSIMMAVVNVFYWAAFTLPRNIQINRLRKRLPRQKVFLFFITCFTNPIIIKSVAAICIFLFSILFGQYLIHNGFWGGFAAPVIFASLVLALNDPIYEVINLEDTRK
jgi:CHASE2 domain.